MHIYSQEVDVLVSFFPKNAVSLELGMLLIGFSFVNILFLCNCCLFTQAVGEVAVDNSHGDSSSSFHFALSWVFPFPF